MPIYYYICQTCNTTTTINQAITETIITPKCDKCGNPMERSYGLQTIIFRGTGWGKDA